MEDVQLMDNIVEYVKKVASSARTNSDEKEIEKVFPEQREVHSLCDGRIKFLEFKNPLLDLNLKFEFLTPMDASLYGSIQPS